MNKIFNINLGGYPFVMDDDAFYKLDKYLLHIKKHFSGSEGCEEIVGDIEARIAELFNENSAGQPIISIRDVEAVMTTMGTPQDFGAEEEDIDYENKKFSSAKTKYTTGRRLYRDTDDKVIAGVCSGLASYFGVSDPLFFRLAFAVMFFAGLGPIAYIIFWIAIPAAKTSADKLSMNGEPINVDNIARKVEEELNKLSDTITGFAKDFSKKN